MTILVDANVLSEATRPEPQPEVLAWLAQHEREIVVDPVILGEIRFGILLLPGGRRRQRLERWFEEGFGLPLATRNRRDFEQAEIQVIDPFAR